jgi:hypothetical protein
VSRLPAPQLRYRTSGFGDFGNFGLSNQLNGMNGLILNETPRILDRQYRDDMTSAIGDLNGAFGFGGSGSGSRGGPANTAGYKELSDSLLGQIGSQGTSQTEKINRSYDASLDSSLARLYDRGFGNSSISTSTQLESDRNRQSSLTELNDSLLSQKIGVGSQIGLAGLNADNANRRAQQQFQYQLYGGLLGGLFG